jgi:predicted Zn-dependent protease
MAMNPDDLARLQSLIKTEKWPEARALLVTIDGAPDDVEWLSLRAEVEAGEGKLEAALELYERILEIKPEHRGALYNSSVVLSDLDRHDDAMTALEGLIEVEGETAAVLNDLAFEYMEAGHNVPGYLSAMRADALASGEMDRCTARLNAATALSNMGRRTEARERIDAMLRDCTDACGEREAAIELRQNLDPRRSRRSSSG